jgi:hypothetical protein
MRRIKLLLKYRDYKELQIYIILTNEGSEVSFNKSFYKL